MKNWAIAIILRKDLPGKTELNQVLSLRCCDTKQQAESDVVQWVAKNYADQTIALVTSIEIK